MQQFRFKTSGVCSTEIVIEIDGGIIKSIRFANGCSGNLEGISRLVAGMPAQEVVQKLRGIDCDGKGTSCPDQLSRALEEFLAKSGNDVA